MKDLYLIENVLNDFLKEFEVTAEVAKEFCYLWEQNKILVTLAVPDFQTKNFMEDFHSRAPEIKLDCFLACFFHELGHCETVDLLTDEEELECYRKRKILNEEAKRTTDEVKLAVICEEYHKLPDEYLATEWAINYIRNNVDKVAKFWADLQKAILTVYEVNEVEDED